MTDIFGERRAIRDGEDCWITDTAGRIIGIEVAGANRKTYFPGFTVDPVTGAATSVNGLDGIPLAGSQNVFRAPILKNTTSAQLKTFCSAGNAITAGYTVITQIPALAPFYGVKLAYANWSLSPTTVTIAKCAAAPTHQNDGSALTWSNITFNGSASVTIPAATGSGNDVVPSIVISDLIPVISVARTDDVTKLPLLQVRSYFAAAGSGINLVGTDIANFNALTSASGGAQWAARLPTGDQVTTISAVQPLEAGSWIVPASVDFQYGTKGFTLASAGDSLTRGQGSTANAYGWPKRLETLLQSSGVNFHACNYGCSGQHLTASMAIAKQIISNVKPNALSFYAWSPNDGAASQAIMDTSWAACLELIELCRQNNIIPVVCTSGPVNGNTAPQDALVKAQNARVRGLPCAVLDVTSVVQDPFNPSQILAAYSAGDGTHYNDAGYQAIAVLANSVISSLLP